LRSQESIAIGQSGAVPGLHPAAAAPLRDVVTRRLAVRRLAGDDHDDLAVLFDDPEVCRFDTTVEETAAFLDRQMRLWTEHGFGGCAVRDLRDGRFLGVVGLGIPTLEHPHLPSVTVGWRFSSMAWGHGYATESGAALLDQAFGPMQLARIGCVTRADNHRSIAVARRLRMHDVAEDTFPRDNGDSAVILEIDREGWLPLSGPDARLHAISAHHHRTRGGR
jgi:RimJ/RimL family protein N-acetyltransferase